MFTLIAAKYMPVPLPVKFSAIAMTVCTGMALYRGIVAWRRYVNLTRLDNYGKEFISIPELINKTKVAAKKTLCGLAKVLTGRMLNRRRCMR